MDTLNAQIKSTKLGFISNGIFDFTLVLDIQVEAALLLVAGLWISTTKRKIKE